MNLIRLYYTLKPLRWEQYWYRLWYPVKRMWTGRIGIPENAIMHALNWPAVSLFSLPVFDKYQPTDNTFCLLNIRHHFGHTINWELKDHGMLWWYHLHYFSWLEDDALSVADRLATLKSYANSAYPTPGDFPKDFAAYPASIRGMAIIRFCLRHFIHEEWLESLLFKECGWLSLFPEYHLQGNHLWQNGCALLMAGYYFNEPKYYHKGKKILEIALEEQVLADGAHIEGSPMYHSLLLVSLLQCIEVSEQSNRFADSVFIAKMRSKAGLMLGWAISIAFSDGSWPQVNDSTGGMAPGLTCLMDFAQHLNINPPLTSLGDCNYRMLRNERMELFIIADTIQPAWQPGHSHSDELSFCLHVDGKPAIVDPGMSTYEANEKRAWERSTIAHNTFSVANKNVSDVWKSFRVGKRATVTIEKDTPATLIAAYDGLGFRFKRQFCLSDDRLVIHDLVAGANKEPVNSHMHFAPEIQLKKSSVENEYLAGNLVIKINGNFAAKITYYQYCLGFNKTTIAPRLQVTFRKDCTITIELLNAN